MTKKTSVYWIVYHTFVYFSMVIFFMYQKIVHKSLLKRLFTMRIVENNFFFYNTCSNG